MEAVCFGAGLVFVLFPLILLLGKLLGGHGNAPRRSRQRSHRAYQAPAQRRLTVRRDAPQAKSPRITLDSYGYPVIAVNSFEQLPPSVDLFSDPNDAYDQLDDNQYPYHVIVDGVRIYAVPRYE